MPLQYLACDIQDKKVSPDSLELLVDKGSVDRLGNKGNKVPQEIQVHLEVKGTKEALEAWGSQEERVHRAQKVLLDSLELLVNKGSADKLENKDYRVVKVR